MPQHSKKKSKGSSAVKEQARLKAQDWVVDGASYTLGRKIGQGAFATAYLATHEPTGKTVVLKRLDRAKQEQMKQVIFHLGCLSDLCSARRSEFWQSRCNALVCCSHCPTVSD